MDLEVTLEELYNGNFIEVSLSYRNSSVCLVTCHMERYSQLTVSALDCTVQEISLLCVDWKRATRYIYACVNSKFKSLLICVYRCYVSNQLLRQFLVQDNATVGKK